MSRPFTTKDNEFRYDLDFRAPAKLAQFVAQRVSRMRILDREEFFAELDRQIPPGMR